MLSKSEQTDILKKLIDASEYCQGQTGDHPNCYLLNEEKDIDDCPYGIICKAFQQVSMCLPEDFKAFETYIEDEEPNEEGKEFSCSLYSNCAGCPFYEDGECTKMDDDWD